MKKGVMVNGPQALKVNPFASTPLVEVSSAWQKEQAAIARRKAQRERILYNGAQAQAVMAQPVLVLKRVDQDKFERLSRELF